MSLLAALVPSGFPVGLYQDTLNALSPRLAGNDEVLTEWLAGMNGVAYRFLAAHEYAGELEASLSLPGGDLPPEPERYRQERALFGLFVSGFSSLECLSYSLFALGALLDAAAFPFGPADRREVDPERALARFQGRFPTDRITSWLSKLINDDGYKRWKLTRNILAHRQAPGRKIDVLAGASERPTEWRGEAFDVAMIAERRSWLLRTLEVGLQASESFVLEHFPANA